MMIAASDLIYWSGVVLVGSITGMMLVLGINFPLPKNNWAAFGVALIMYAAWIILLGYVAIPQAGNLGAFIEQFIDWGR
jgi:hypothetical protein